MNGGSLSGDFDNAFVVTKRGLFAGGGGGGHKACVREAAFHLGVHPAGGKVIKVTGGILVDLGARARKKDICWELPREPGQFFHVFIKCL